MVTNTKSAFCSKVISFHCNSNQTPKQIDQIKANISVQSSKVIFFLAVRSNNARGLKLWPLLLVSKTTRLIIKLKTKTTAKKTARTIKIGANKIFHNIGLATLVKPKYNRDVNTIENSIKQIKIGIRTSK